MAYESTQQARSTDGKRRKTRPGDPLGASAGRSRVALRRRRGVESAPLGIGRAAAPPALPPRAGGLSGRLASLAETAKAYARSAQADNTRRAYAAELENVRLLAAPPGPLRDAAQSGGRRPLPRGSNSGAAARNCRSRRWNGGCRGSPGATASSDSRSIFATAISRRCSPGSAAGTRALPFRKPRSSPTSWWRCWRRWTST